MAVQLIVPFRGDCEHRERNWNWLRSRYETEGWDVVEALAPDGPWCKAAAVTPAVEASEADIVAVVDADCWLPGLGEAVDAVQAGAPWAIPHLKVNRLTEEASAAVLAGHDFDGQKLVQRPYGGIIGGGAVVARREVILSTPLDARFTGWG